MSRLDEAVALRSSSLDLGLRLMYVGVVLLGFIGPGRDAGRILAGFDSAGIVGFIMLALVQLLVVAAVLARAEHTPVIVLVLVGALVCEFVMLRGAGGTHRLAQGGWPDGWFNVVISFPVLWAQGLVTRAVLSALAFATVMGQRLWFLSRADVPWRLQAVELLNTAQLLMMAVLLFEGLRRVALGVSASDVRRRESQLSEMRLAGVAQSSTELDRVLSKDVLGLLERIADGVPGEEEDRVRWQSREALGVLSRGARLIERLVHETPMPDVSARPALLTHVSDQRVIFACAIVPYLAASLAMAALQQHMARPWLAWLATITVVVSAGVGALVVARSQLRWWGTLVLTMLSVGAVAANIVAAPFPMPSTFDFWVAGSAVGSIMLIVLFRPLSEGLLATMVQTTATSLILPWRYGVDQASGPLFGVVMAPLTLYPLLALRYVTDALDRRQVDADREAGLAIGQAAVFAAQAGSTERRLDKYADELTPFFALVAGGRWQVGDRDVRARAAEHAERLRGDLALDEWSPGRDAR